MIFVTRCQNLNTTNAADWTGNDGGFVYTAANGGESLASEKAGNGRHGDANLKPGEGRSLRSYGSMTYAGFKSLLYAGLGPEDPRTRAALDWMRRHWTFERNPGLGQQGYYYYLYTMARALKASGLDIIRSSDGQEHDWRVELSQALISRQKPDGSWRNPTDRWLEEGGSRHHLCGPGDRGDAQANRSKGHSAMMNMILVLVAALAGNIMMDDRQPIEFEMHFPSAISEGFSGSVYLMFTRSERRTLSWAGLVPDRTLLSHRRRGLETGHAAHHGSGNTGVSRIAWPTRGWPMAGPGGDAVRSRQCIDRRRQRLHQ